jgi:hypothetical protein
MRNPDEIQKISTAWFKINFNYNKRGQLYVIGQQEGILALGTQGLKTRVPNELWKICKALTIPKFQF